MNYVAVYLSFILIECFAFYHTRMLRLGKNQNTDNDRIFKNSSISTINSDLYFAISFLLYLSFPIQLWRTYSGKMYDEVSGRTSYACDR